MRLGAPAMLWERALRCCPAPSPAEDSGADSDTDKHDGLACTLASALADLLAFRGGMKEAGPVVWLATCFTVCALCSH